MRFWGYALEGMYTDKQHFFFSILPAIGIEREDEFWCLQIIWLNMTLAIFTGVDVDEG